MLQPTTNPGKAPILVPVDLSASSNEAMLLAAQLAGLESQPLVILHVAHDDMHQPNIYPRRNDRERALPLEELAESALQDFMSGMRKQHPGIEVLADAGMMVVGGLPATRIPEIARKIGASLVVMGGNGRTSLSKLIAGSVSDKVVRNSPVPVTIIHSHGTAWGHGESVDISEAC